MPPGNHIKLSELSDVTERNVQRELARRVDTIAEWLAGFFNVCNGTGLSTDKLWVEALDIQSKQADAARTIQDYHESLQKVSDDAAALRPFIRDELSKISRHCAHIEKMQDTGEIAGRLAVMQGQAVAIRADLKIAIKFLEQSQREDERVLALKKRNEELSERIVSAEEGLEDASYRARRATAEARARREDDKELAERDNKDRETLRLNNEELQKEIDLAAIWYGDQISTHLARYQRAFESRERDYLENVELRASLYATEAELDGCKEKVKSLRLELQQAQVEARSWRNQVRADDSASKNLEIHTLGITVQQLELKIVMEQNIAESQREQHRLEICALRVVETQKDAGNAALVERIYKEKNKLLNSIIDLKADNERLRAIESDFLRIQRSTSIQTKAISAANLQLKEMTTKYEASKLQCLAKDLELSESQSLARKQSQEVASWKHQAEMAISRWSESQTLARKLSEEAGSGRVQAEQARSALSESQTLGRELWEEVISWKNESEETRSTLSESRALVHKLSEEVLIWSNQAEELQRNLESQRVTYQAVVSEHDGTKQRLVERKQEIQKLQRCADTQAELVESLNSKLENANTELRRREQSLNELETRAATIADCFPKFAREILVTSFEGSVQRALTSGELASMMELKTMVPEMEWQGNPDITLGCTNTILPPTTAIAIYTSCKRVYVLHQGVFSTHQIYALSLDMTREDGSVFIGVAVDSGSFELQVAQSAVAIIACQELAKLAEIVQVRVAELGDHTVD